MKTVTRCSSCSFWCMQWIPFETSAVVTRDRVYIATKMENRRPTDCEDLMTCF